MLDATRNSCGPGSPFRWAQYVPFYNFNIWVMQLTLGVRMTSEMGLNIDDGLCTGSSSTRTGKDLNSFLYLRPDAKVKFSGEGSGKVLVVRGGVNLGGDFNYWADLKLRRHPDMCITALNGHKPMSVGVESWYQTYDVGCEEWSERKIYSPQTFAWKLFNERQSQWLDNECFQSKGAAKKAPGLV